MTYSDNIRAGIDGLHDAAIAAQAGIESAARASMTDPVSSNGVTLGSAIAHAKRARDRIDAVLESLETARAHATLEHAKAGEPSKPFRPHVIATGTPPVRDYPDGVA